MKKLLLAGVSLAAIGMINGAIAADATPPVKANGCINGGDPYKNYSCLDAYLGTDFASRFVNYYKLEWGHEAPPADPKAPPAAGPNGPRLPKPFRPIRSPNGPMAGRPALA
jgi:hypothetical protein